MKKIKLLDHNDRMFLKHIDYQIKMLEKAKEEGYYSGDWFVYQELTKRYLEDDLSEKEFDEFIDSSPIMSNNINVY